MTRTNHIAYACIFLFGVFITQLPAEPVPITPDTQDADILPTETEIEPEKVKKGDYVWVSYRDSKGRSKTIEGHVKTVDSKGITLRVFAGKRIEYAAISKIKLMPRKSSGNSIYFSIAGGFSRWKSRNPSRYEIITTYDFGAGVRHIGKYASSDIALIVFHEKRPIQGRNPTTRYDLSAIALGYNLSIHPVLWRKTGPYALLGGGAGLSWGGIVPYYNVGAGFQIVPFRFLVTRFEIRRYGFNERNNYRLLIDLGF